MNFYIGSSINEVNVEDTNVEFSDELIEFIYKLSEQNSFSMNKLYEIDPYSDVEVSKYDLPEIIKICNYILGSSLLKNYEKEYEARKMLHNLMELSQSALGKNVGLVSIGD